MVFMDSMLFLDIVFMSNFVPIFVRVSINFTILCSAGELYFISGPMGMFFIYPNKTEAPTQNPHLRMYYICGVQLTRKPYWSTRLWS